MVDRGVNCICFNTLNRKQVCIQAANYEGDYWFAEQMEDGSVRAVALGSEVRMPSWLTIQ